MVKAQSEQPLRRFRVVEGGSTPRKEARRHSEQVVCRRCALETGVASSEWIETRLAPRERGGKIVDRGVRSLVCVPCLTRGVLTRQF